MSISKLNTSEFIKLEENLVSSELKVANPTFLKTGVLGLIINSLGVLKSDNAFFLNSLVKESSPATAETYESLFFHSTVKDLNIEFSSPSEFLISFIIPEVSLNQGEIIKYTIGRDTILIDDNKWGYTLEDPIEIYLSNGTIRGKRYGQNIDDLDVYRTTHPNDPSQYIYLVNTTVKQYDRIFRLEPVPALDEDPHSFSINIPSANNIYQINAWRQQTTYVNNVAQEPKPLNISSIRSNKSSDFGLLYELQPLDIKYAKNLSNQSDEHIFIKFSDTSINFTTGDGIFGRKPKTNEKILIELKLTEGRNGNIPSTSFTVNDILCQQINPDGTINTKNTVLRAVSIDGGSGGYNIESKEDIRRKILNPVGKFIGSISDIKNAFYLDSGVPYIDKKYFNSKHNIFIYNIIRDQANKIIQTTTRNLKLSELENNPFLPEYTYDGVELISPFYYVNFKDRFNAYLIIPEIKLDIIHDTGVDLTTKLEINPTLYLTYDWFDRKTYLELRGANGNYTYVVSCNINSSINLSAGNSFRVEINKTFLNDYCLFDGFSKVAYAPDSNEQILVPGYLTDIKLSVYDGSLFKLSMTQPNKFKYTQLKLKQEHYYWIDIDTFDPTKEVHYVLNIPYLEKSYVTQNIKNAAAKLDYFFSVIDKSENTNPNLCLTQAFYNTIKIEEVYRNYIFETTDVYVQPKISMNMELLISSINLQRSKWTTTIDLETDLKFIVNSYTDSLEGYNIVFNESQLEQLIMNYFNADYNVIENIKIWNPSGPIRVRDSSVIYSLMEDNFGSAHMNYTEQQMRDLVLTGTIPNVTQKQIVDFVPPFFSFSRNIGIEFKSI